MKTLQAADVMVRTELVNLSSPTGPVISETPADVGSTTVELDPAIDYSGFQITQDHWTSSKK